MAFVSGLLLAAGLSRRMGVQKLLLSFQGRPLLRHSMENLLRSTVDEIIIVLQHGSETIRAADSFLAGWREKTKKRIYIAENSRSAEGMASSLSLGISHTSPQSDGYLVTLGDMPFVTTDIIDAAVERFRAKPTMNVQCLFMGRRGHPVIFSKQYRPRLLALKGDQGGRDLLQGNPETMCSVEFNTDTPLFDVDIPEDIIRFSAETRRGNNGA